MSPRPGLDLVVASPIASQLNEQLGTLAVTEVAVLTTAAGVRVPDVAWMPAARWLPADSELVAVPDLVVEVLSPSDRKAEVLHKVGLSGVRRW